MTLLPFDIETARFAVIAGTGKVVTREGYPVEITCWNSGDELDIWPIIGKIHFPDSEINSIESWSIGGRYSYDLSREHKFDLFIETEFDL